MPTTLTWSSAVSLASAVLQLALGALLLGLSRAPRWRALQWLALVAVFGGMFALASMGFTLKGLDDTVRAFACRTTVTFSALHAVSWLCFLQTEQGRALYAYERTMIAVVLVVGAAVQVPGLLLGSTVVARTVSWLPSLTWYDVAPTRVGVLFFSAYLAGILFIAARTAANPQHERNRTALLVALFFGGGHDALASAGLIDMPYLFDLVYLFSVVVVATSVTKKVLTSARALETSSERLAQAQAELVKRERLAALGELSAVVAHEVRNPLGVLFNGIGQLRRLAPQGSETDTLVRVMAEEATRLDRMVDELLDLTRPAPSRPTEVQLGELVDSAVAAARDSWRGAPAEVEIEVQPGLPPARVDPELVRRAIVNLVTNALQVTKHSKPIKVRVSRDEASLRVDVIDDGPGVPAEHREHIFAPFFTTRAQGTGLGLAVVQRVAEAHGGSVGVSSSENGGAVFSLVLPDAR